MAIKPHIWTEKSPINGQNYKNTNIIVIVRLNEIIYSTYLKSLYTGLTQWKLKKKLQLTNCILVTKNTKNIIK